MPAPIAVIVVLVTVFVLLSAVVIVLSSIASYIAYRKEHKKRELTTKPETYVEFLKRALKGFSYPWYV